MKVLLLLVVMARVTGVSENATLLVQKDAKQVEVRLAGIEITDPRGARELLRWSVGDSWVMIEGADAQALVYRSPDALFINRELVERGYARATQAGIARPLTVPVTYHGQLDLGVRPDAKQAPAKKKAAVKSGGSEPRTRTGSRKSRPSAKSH
ncbi:MAG TPA: hypothetical protein VF618_15400 [Thermoanaerobaculia bacterium]